MKYTFVAIIILFCKISFSQNNASDSAICSGFFTKAFNNDWAYKQLEIYYKPEGLALL